jgi:hypothetical protein
LLDIWITYHSDNPTVLVKRSISSVWPFLNTKVSNARSPQSKRANWSETKMTQRKDKSRAASENAGLPLEVVLKKGNDRDNPQGETRGCLYTDPHKQWPTHESRPITVGRCSRIRTYISDREQQDCTTRWENVQTSSHNTSSECGAASPKAFPWTAICEVNKKCIYISGSRVVRVIYHLVNGVDFSFLPTVAPRETVSFPKVRRTQGLPEAYSRRTARGTVSFQYHAKARAAWNYGDNPHDIGQAKWWPHSKNLTESELNFFFFFFQRNDVTLYRNKVLNSLQCST